ncbi:MAG: ABC transporter permease [Gammaproteobacteria bacterium]
MHTADFLRFIFRSVLSARMRSALTALGIAIGIMAVTLLTAIGEGVRSYVMDTFSQFGTNIMNIAPGHAVTGGMGGLLNTVRPLTLDDAEAIRRLPEIRATVPNVSGMARIGAGNRQRNAMVLGATPDALEVWKLDVASGSFLPPDDIHAPRAFAVIGSKLRAELFGTRNALGQWIRIGDSRYLVIGTLESKGQLLGFDLDDAAYIPVSRSMQLFNREGLMQTDIMFQPGLSSEQVARRVKAMMIDRHGREDFSIVTQDEMLGTLDRILNVLTMSIAALGSISLLVGGVGILTIMTTAVRERVSEIGLLRAIGATERQVLLLFLGEAIVLSLLGGLAGIAAMALIVTSVAVAVPGLPLSPQPLYIVIALLVSGLIGLIAGVAPARHAARLDPIESLRTE